MTGVGMDTLATANTIPSVAPAKRRDHLWKPGVSPNPSGRPKENPELKAAARAHTMDALNTLVDVMKNGKKDSDRVAAAGIILDRGHGKATQHVDVSGSNMSLVDLLVSLSQPTAPAAPVIEGEAQPVEVHLIEEDQPGGE